MDGKAMKVGDLIQDRTLKFIGLVVAKHKPGSASHRKIPSVSILWTHDGTITEEEILMSYLKVLNEGR